MKTALNETVTKSKLSKRRFFKRASRRLLFSEWLMQVFVFITVGAIFYGIFQFGAALGFAVHEITANEKLSVLLISVFIVFAIAILVPLLYGLFAFEINAVSPKKCNASDVFCAFSSGEKLYRAYDLFFGLVFRYAFYFLPAILLHFYNILVYPNTDFVVYYGGVDVVLFLLRTLFVVLLFLGIMLSTKGFAAIYICIKTDKSAAESFYLAKKCMKNNGLEAVKLALSFFPLFVISLFTVGFLFLLYTIPYMFITFVMYSKYLYEKYWFEYNNLPYYSQDGLNQFCE